MIQCFAKSNYVGLYIPGYGAVLWQSYLFSRFQLYLNPRILWAGESYPILLDCCLFQYALHFLNGILCAVPLHSAGGTWNRKPFKGTPLASISHPGEREDTFLPLQGWVLPVLHRPPLLLLLKSYSYILKLLNNFIKEIKLHLNYWHLKRLHVNIK